jgi:diguanylate cyclase (GGDEF)-like protein/PAS domain S-box-containing protein
MFSEEIVESIFDGICVINGDNLIEYVNPALLALTGYTKDELVGKDLSLLLPIEVAPLHADYIKQYISGQKESKIIGKLRKLDLKIKSGAYKAIELKVFRLPEKEGKHYFVGVIRDLHQRLLASFEYNRLLYGLNDIGYLDEVSHLPNQKFILFRMEAYLNTNYKEGIFAFIDVDGLEMVNQQYGREAGDELLARIGKEIQSNIRVKDTIARWENSSLAILLPMSSLSDAIQLLDRLRSEIANSKGFLNQDHSFIPSVSIGCSRIVPPKQPIDTYIMQAGKALVKAKKEGKNKLFIYGFYSD